MSFIEFRAESCGNARECTCVQRLAQICVILPHFASDTNQHTNMLSVSHKFVTFPTHTHARKHCRTIPHEFQWQSIYRPACRNILCLAVNRNSCEWLQSDTARYSQTSQTKSKIRSACYKKYPYIIQNLNSIANITMNFTFSKLFFSSKWFMPLLRLYSLHFFLLFCHFYFLFTEAGHFEISILKPFE